MRSSITRQLSTFRVSARVTINGRFAGCLQIRIEIEWRLNDTFA
jgi:hypothetical protein